MSTLQRKEISYTAVNITVTSTKTFEKTVQDLLAELGRTGTELLDIKFSSAKNLEELVAEIEPLAGRSGLINVATLNWGKMMSRVPVAMKAMHFALGNPLTAKKLLEAGGVTVGLYLPTRIFVYEDTSGVTQISYDKMSSVFSSWGNAGLTAVGEKIDGVLEKLASSAAL